MRLGWGRPGSLALRRVLTNRMREYFTYGSVGGPGATPAPTRHRMTRSAVSWVFQRDRPWRVARHRSAAVRRERVTPGLLNRRQRRERRTDTDSSLCFLRYLLLNLQAARYCDDDADFFSCIFCFAVAASISCTSGIAEPQAEDAVTREKAQVLLKFCERIDGAT